jgi:hypothetical protein
LHLLHQAPVFNVPIRKHGKCYVDKDKKIYRVINVAKRYLHKKIGKMSEIFDSNFDDYALKKYLMVRFGNDVSHETKPLSTIKHIKLQGMSNTVLPFSQLLQLKSVYFR